MTRLTPTPPTRERIERAQTLAGLHAQAKEAERVNDYKTAVGLWEGFLRVESGDAEAWCQLGTAWLNLRQHNNAKACMQQALRVMPTFLPALIGLADCLTLTGEPGKGLVKLERARALLKPGDRHRLPFHLARGNALYAAGKHREAEAAYRLVLAESPTWATAWSTLGNLLTDQGKYAEARDAFRKGWELSKVPALGMNYSLACLMLGEWETGWNLYRERLRDLNHEGFRRFHPVKPWQGQPLEGNLLVYAEQGLGDLIQFARFLPWARKQVKGEILLEVAADQLGLMERAAGCWDQLLVRPELGVPRAVEYDAWVGLMDLVPLSGLIYPDQAPEPLLFSLPYLSLFEARTICLHWRGNPAHGNDQNRSLPLKLLLPLIESRPEIDWITTTPDKAARAEVEALGNPIRVIPGSLAESAQRWAACDLMITVDSGPAHICGSLGVPTWIMLPFVPDWRWQREGSKSAWYPSARLFRQERPGSWGQVVHDLTVALAQFCSAG